MSELTQPYFFSSMDKKLISHALNIIEEKFLTASENTPAFINPHITVDYIRLQLCDHEREHFIVVYLNNQNRLIKTEKLFSGGLHSVEVRPSVIARQALLHNANGVILAHNHPSGSPAPSQEDIQMTQKIKACLSILDIRVLDHIIVTPGERHYSFAEHCHL